MTDAFDRKLRLGFTFVIALIIAEILACAIVQYLRVMDAREERAEYRNRTLVEMGYQYGLAVERLHLEGPGTYACLQLRNADDIAGQLPVPLVYLNGKLTGLAAMRQACAGH
jgi:hypothetical protein